MKILITLTFLFLTFGQLYGQKKQCHCDKDTLMNNATTNCKTTILNNQSKLYWQFNCERIWLTLENLKGQKKIIDEVEVGLFGYTYRLGFYLIREFDKTLLFRSGCPANGPCIYTLLNKSTGKKIKEYRQLICIDTESKEKTKYQFAFVVYPDSNFKNIIIDYININKKLTIPFDLQENNLTSVIPEYQFDKIKLERNILTLFYTRTDNKKLNLKIILNNKKYSR
jgi:hypothetical protein